MAGNSSYSGTARDAIARCTICTVFDGRIFLSGNPELPNTVFYSHRDLTGANNPAYFGTLNYFNDGVGSQPVTAMMATAYALCVLKKEAEAESAVYYHTGADGGSDILPRVYPSASGSAGIGCVGCACNFSDDPVFLSKRGLEAIGREQVNLERAIEHRSYNVDVKLCAEDLSNARMAEWLGYLVIMCGGHFYLADSRQLFTHKTGVINYEWYYLEDIGSYAGQTQRYYTLTEDMMLNVNGETVSLTQLSVYHGGVYHPLMLSSEREYIEPGSQIRVFPYHNGSMLDTEVFCTVTADGKYIAVDTEGEMAGGTYNAPCELCVINDVLYFGTEDGKVFCFNTDMRGRSVDVGGEEVPVDADRIHRSFYTFDGRRIVSCCVTKSDNCDLPHVTKKTRRGSFVVRAKPFAASKIKARGKIDRGELSEWRELNTSGSSEMDFSDIAFDSFSFAGSSAHLCIVRESFRRWYEKQMCFYSDEYRSPFGIYSAVFCYCVQGRIRI